MGGVEAHRNCPELMLRFESKSWDALANRGHGLGENHEPAFGPTAQGQWTLTDVGRHPNLYGLYGHIMVKSSTLARSIPSMGYRGFQYYWPGL